MLVLVIPHAAFLVNLRPETAHLGCQNGRCGMPEVSSPDGAGIPTAPLSERQGTHVYRWRAVTRPARPRRTVGYAGLQS